MIRDNASNWISPPAFAGVEMTLLLRYLGNAPPMAATGFDSKHTGFYPIEVKTSKPKLTQTAGKAKGPPSERSVNVPACLIVHPKTCPCFSVPSCTG
jgi:hypothetical protein